MSRVLVSVMSQSLFNTLVIPSFFFPHRQESNKSLTYTVQTAKAQIKLVVKRRETEAMLRRCERHRRLDESGSGVRAG